MATQGSRARQRHLRMEEKKRRVGKREGGQGGGVIAHLIVAAEPHVDKSVWRAEVCE